MRLQFIGMSVHVGCDNGSSELPKKPLLTVCRRRQVVLRIQRIRFACPQVTVRGATVIYLSQYSARGW